MLRIRRILVLTTMLILSSVCTAKPEFNVDFRCGWGDCYRPMEWTPVEIGVGSTLTKPFGCAIELSAAQDGLNNLHIAHEFVLTPDVFESKPLVTKFAFAADKCTVRLVPAANGRRGRREVWSHDFDLWGGSGQTRMLTVIAEKDMLVGQVGLRQFDLLNLPKKSYCQTQRGSGEVYLGNKLARMVPWDWTGFVSLDILILYAPDWSLFRLRQLDAIAQWVSNGGKLLLVLGTAHPIAPDNPLNKVLPVEIGQLKQTTIDVQLLSDWGLKADEGETVACWPLVPKINSSLCETEVSDANECVFAVGYAGFGRVGVLAFNPATLSAAHKDNAVKFWVGRITAVLEDSQIKRSSSERSSSSRSRSASSHSYQRSMQEPFRAIKFADGSGNRSGGRSISHFETGLAQAGNNAVMNYLYKGIRPLSIWWVILLLTVLAVLLGPLDYIVLKRKGRLPWTWVTCTFWIAIFTVGAYYGVHFLRAGDLEMRVVSVLDGFEDGRWTWSTNYCGLFAPRSDDYKLVDLRENQWWSGMAPSEQSLYSYRQRSGSRRIYCQQVDGRNWPESLPINIWTIQCLVNEAPLARLPYTAKVERRGDEIVLNITNESESAIAAGYVIFDGGVGFEFARVPAGADKEFRGSLGNVSGWRSGDMSRIRDSYYRYGRSDNSGTFRNADAFFAQGSLQRTQAIDAYLSHGAAVVCVEYEQAPLPFKVDARSCKYDHIQLARLVVFPKDLEKGAGDDTDTESY